MSDGGDDTLSRTARSVAMARAIETMRPAAQRLFEDPHAIRLVPGAGRRAILRSLRLPPLRAGALALWERLFPGVMAGLVARTRFLDDATVAAVRDGARQVVILGAGFDSRALRLPALGPARVFEVDRSANLAWKRARLRGVPSGDRQAGSPTHVPVDFEHESLVARLGAAGLAPGTPTSFLWEGVTQYLTAEGVDATLAAVRQLGSRGSRLAFTYVRERAVVEPGSESAAAAAAGGEPWRFGIEPTALGGFLAERGFELLEDVGASAYRERYFEPLGRSEPIWETERAAIARWAG